MSPNIRIETKRSTLEERQRRASWRGTYDYYDETRCGSGQARRESTSQSPKQPQEFLHFFSLVRGDSHRREVFCHRAAETFSVTLMLWGEPLSFSAGNGNQLRFEGEIRLLYLNCRDSIRGPQR